MKRKLTPSYLPHSSSGRARIVWYDATRLRRQKLLAGLYDSDESRTAFARFQLELISNPGASSTSNNNLTVAEGLDAYLDFATRYYRKPDGAETSEVKEIKLSIRPVREQAGPFAHFVRFRSPAWARDMSRSTIRFQSWPFHSRLHQCEQSQ